MAVQGILSKGAKFSFATSQAGSYTEVENLLEIPSLGGSVDKVDVTVLANAARHYIPGLIDYGDLAFKFLYDNSTATSNYRQLKAVENTNIWCKVEFPDETVFAFEAIPAVTTDAATVGAALTFTVNMGLQSDIEVTNPA